MRATFSQLNGVKLEVVRTAANLQVCQLWHYFGSHKGNEFYRAEPGELAAAYKTSLNILGNSLGEGTKLYLALQKGKASLLERLRPSNQAPRYLAKGQTESGLT